MSRLNAPFLGSVAHVQITEQLVLHKCQLLYQVSQVVTGTAKTGPGIGVLAQIDAMEPDNDGSRLSSDSAQYGVNDTLIRLFDVL